MITIPTVEKIKNSHRAWSIMGYPEPDTIILCPGEYFEFLDYIQKMMPVNNVLSPEGRYKYMGMDVIYSHCINSGDVRVCKTKVE